MVAFLCWALFRRAGNGRDNDKFLRKGAILGDRGFLNRRHSRYPLADTVQIVGGIWIVVGSAIFFGTIIATITTYFMRPLQHPVKQIVNTTEYNLEQLEDLSVDELDLLKETTDMLIEHIERLKQERQPGNNTQIGKE